MQTYNLSVFFEWWINSINVIITRIINIIGGIQLYNGVWLDDFLLAVIILGGVLPIIISTPNRVKMTKESRTKNVQKSRKGN